jgi:opacity protein-like surface antigen
MEPYMKLRISSSIFLFALTTAAFACSPAESARVTTPGKFYVGLFGGGGSSNKFNASQYGTAFFPEASGGPLSVNAFGQLNSRSASFFGAQLGYQTQELLLNSSSQWSLGPAAELEGYSTSKSSFKGTLTNDTARLPEHDFTVSYPMRRTVFLANGVISFNNPRLPVHPYVGVGMGAAIIRISDATSTQVSPAEEGINHYNSRPNDTTSTFAGQVKLGLSYDVNPYISFFADYRWLYLANTHFVFGSTVYPSHVETSDWQVKLGAQQYSLINVGARFNW